MPRNKPKIINFRVTEADYLSIHEKASKLNLSLSAYLLTMAIDGKITHIDGLQDVTRALRAIGNNINQLTRLCHEGKIQCLQLDTLTKETRAVWQLLNSQIPKAR